MDPFYRFELGDFECCALYDHSRVASAQEVFPSVPGSQLLAAMEAYGNDFSELTIGYNCLYVNTGRERLLVDSGSGEGQLLDSLAQAGVEPDQIEVLVITHGDGDHIGGLQQFPAARIILWQRAWDLWTSVSGRQQMVDEFLDLFRENVPPPRLSEMGQRRQAYGRDVLPALANRVQRVAAEQEFLPGFKLVAAPGHRSDHAALEIRSAGQSLLHVVDGLRHPVQAAHPDWTSYIDSYPIQTAASNRLLMARAAAAGSLLFAAHLPFPGLGRVESDGTAWRWLHDPV